MKIEVLGVDHIYIAVSDLARSTAFYDSVMKLLGFCKGTSSIEGQIHVHYFNCFLQYTLRPGKADGVLHDPLRPGLHHLCFQVADVSTVDNAFHGLQKLGIKASDPKFYPEFGADYYSVFFADPDGIELEIVNRTQLRKIINDNWDKLDQFENPLRKAGLI
ncbi:MAG: VOC family protein [Candidatus Ozemobacteraceae bacterium]